MGSLQFLSLNISLSRFIPFPNTESYCQTQIQLSFDDHDTLFILLILMFKGKSKDYISSQTACSGRKNVESCLTMVFAQRMETPHCDCCAAPGSTQLPRLDVFFQQAPATSDQQDYLHLHHSPNLQKTSYEPNIPSSAQHRFQSPVNQEHLPASELHTYLFNLKERPLPFISRLCCFFYAVAFRGLFCSRNGKYFTSQQFVQEASTHSSIFQPCQPCDKV